MSQHSEQSETDDGQEGDRDSAGSDSDVEDLVATAEGSTQSAPLDRPMQTASELNRSNVASADANPVTIAHSRTVTSAPPLPPSTSYQVMAPYGQAVVDQAIRALNYEAAGIRVVEPPLHASGGASAGAARVTPRPSPSTMTSAGCAAAAGPSSAQTQRAPDSVIMPPPTGLPGHLTAVGQQILGHVTMGAPMPTSEQLNAAFMGEVNALGAEIRQIINELGEEAYALLRGDEARPTDATTLRVLYSTPNLGPAWGEFVQRVYPTLLTAAKDHRDGKLWEVSH